MSLKYLLVVVQLQIYLIIASSGFKSYEGYKLYDVTPKTKQEQNHLRSLSSESYDVWSMPNQLGSTSKIMVPPYFQNKFELFLQRFNISYIVSVNNVEQIVQKERLLQTLTSKCNNRMAFNRYYRYNEIRAYLNRLAKKYPSLVKVTTIGQSYEKREIKVIHISNKTATGKKNTVLVDGGIHAREWIAPASALYIIHQLVENSENENILKNLDFFILPLVNPDGYEYTHTKERFWRKTRNPAEYDYPALPGEIRCVGVDANRNFDFHWGENGTSSSPCAETYRGKTAFSEPETVALRDLLHSISGKCKFYLSLHAFGNMMLYPWGHTSSLPDNWNDIDDVAKAGAAAIQNATGTKYIVGSSTNVLYSASGGSADYALGIEQIPISITMELPSGGEGLSAFDPFPSKIQNIVEESWIGIKAMVLSVDEKFRT